MALSGTKLYCLQNGQALPANEALYSSEADLQQLIAENPQLLLPDPQDGEKRLYLVARELPLRDMPDGAFCYALDHLFLDQDGVPVLVEVKRSSDTRIRREVVGQMLDYAARMSLLDASELKALAPDTARIPDELWPLAGENLKAGQMKLIFAADSIPDSLALLIDFLDRSMEKLEVYGVELRQYLAPGGCTLVSASVVGGAASFEKRLLRPATLWDAESVAAQLREYGNAQAASLVAALTDFIAGVGLHAEYARGSRFGLVRAMKNGRKVFSITSWEKSGLGLRTVIELSFPALVSQTAGQLDEQTLGALLLRFPAASAAELAQYVFGSTRFPYIDLRLLENPAHMAHFQAAIRKIVATIPDV